MDYQSHYDRLISKAQNRIFTGYTERHHIIPECVGGPDTEDNIVRLTPEEHYVAHQLLVKIHNRNRLLVFAAHMMGATRKGNKSYGWLRRANSEARKSVCHLSDEAKKSISDKNKGHKRWAGKQHSEETKAKISASRKGKGLGNKGSTGVEPPNKGIPMTDSQKAKLTGRSRTPEQRERISAGKAGKCSDAARKQLEACHAQARGKKPSPETLAKRAEGLKAYWAARRLAKTQPQ